MIQKKYDTIIIGNGSIGLLSAFLIKSKFPRKKIALIGKENFKYSASLAAGAMHNVYCEIEGNFHESILEQANFEMGLKSRDQWKKILKKIKMQKAITAKDTFFYLKNGSSEFERKNFDVACEIAKRDKVLFKANKKDIDHIFRGRISSKRFNCVKIKNEFGFNPKIIMNKLIMLSRKIGIDIYFHEVKKVVKLNNNYLIDELFKSNKLVIAAGYGSHYISKKIFKPIPILKGVGTAFILQEKYFKNVNNIVRTSNRGGAQCGLHIVPYDKKSGKIYVGAGNYITKEKQPLARADTIRYLLELIENELIPKEVIYNSKIINLLGYRPKSLDNCPSIGPVNDTLFYVSGTYRSGLSWASFIANQILLWSNNQNVDELLKYYNPSRSIKSWGNLNEACDYYASSRLSNLLEHGLIKKEKTNLTKKYKNLYDYANNINSKIIKDNNYRKNFVADPDCYNYFEK